MKTKVRIARAARLAALATLLASSARAQMVAGWDFSQYFVDGALSVDGETLTATLPANYSDLDTSFGAGPDSGAFGTMHLDGAFGSTSTPLDFDNDPIVPSAAAGGSLVSNLGAPENGEPSPDVPFDACTVLATEGQLFCNPLALIARQSASVAFEADLGSVSQTADAWSVSFAGRTFSGTSTVTVDFSSGGGYSQAGSVELTTTDSLYTLTGSGAASDKAWFRFNFNPSGADQPFLDNVAISVVPEAGAAAQLVAAVGALLLVRRRA